MSFFFRKSFRLGPFRFNLSKSGLGISSGTNPPQRIPSRPRPGLLDLAVFDLIIFLVVALLLVGIAWLLR